MEHISRLFDGALVEVVVIIVSRKIFKHRLLRFSNMPKRQLKISIVVNKGTTEDA